MNQLQLQLIPGMKVRIHPPKMRNWGEGPSFTEDMLHAILKSKHRIFTIKCVDSIEPDSDCYELKEIPGWVWWDKWLEVVL